MTDLTALRRLCLIEGLSLILLLGVAMPLKYLAGQPLAVRYVGLVHGLLWLALVALLVVVALRHRWTLGRGIAVFISSLLPFGFLVMDRRMKTWSGPAEPSG